MRRKGRLSHKKREGETPTTLNDRELIKREMLHSALASRTRLKILAMLEGRSMFGHEIVKKFSIGQSTVSYHLGILRAAGLITTHPQARGTLYSPAKGANES
ncbi:MAG: ArsR/SmtB family transcription factor [Nitrospiria bacterium]